MNRTNKAYIGIGSNLSDPLTQVERAFDRIDAITDSTIISKSSVYVTSPVGFTDQADFINAVCIVATKLQPMELFSELQQIEREQGRVKDALRNRPRIIDLDLLLYETIVMSDENLTLPHPRMHERRFVLEPIAEIDPSVKIPGYGNVLNLLLNLQNQKVEKVEGIGHR